MKFSKLVVPLLAALFPLAIIAFGIATITQKDAASTLKITNVEFTTTPGQENLVEIFSDGLDYEQQKAVIESDAAVKDALKDFYIFDKFITAGVPTFNGKTTSLGGFNNFNKFALLKRFPNSDLEEATYQRGVMIEALSQHLDVSRSSFSTPQLFGVYDTFSANSLDDASYLQSKLTDANVASWASSRDFIAGEWGVTSNAPDTNSYAAVVKAASINNSAKGARVLIQDMTTHAPWIAGPVGELGITYNSDAANKAVARNITNTLRGLKALKNNNSSVYDNSMIVIWGDHSRHELPVSTLDEQLRHAHSALLIKFPHETKNALTYVSDRLVWAPQLNRIIREEYLAHRGISFINNSADFRTNRGLYLSVNKDNKYYAARWDENKGQLVADLGRSDLVFNPNLDNDQINVMFSDALGGHYD